MYVEGLVHITSLPQDYYRFEPAQHRLLGERTKKAFRLGDELRVKVARVDLDERKVDFELSEILPRKRKRVKASDKAKALADGYEQEQVRRSGGRKAKKRAVKPADNEAAASAAPKKKAKKPVKKKKATKTSAKKKKK